MTYFNTTHQADPQLSLFTLKAESQTEAVLAIFQQQRRPLSPSQVWQLCPRDALGEPLWPLTSVRRAITVLTDKRHELERTATQAVGHYGRPEYLWQVPA